MMTSAIDLAFAILKKQGMPPWDYQQAMDDSHILANPNSPGQRIPYKRHHYRGQMGPSSFSVGGEDPGPDSHPGVPCPICNGTGMVEDT